LFGMFIPPLAWFAGLLSCIREIGRTRWVGIGINLAGLALLG
jgi:hypothetical protein